MDNSTSVIKSIQWQGDVATINLAGEIDLHVSNQLQQDLTKVLASKPARIFLNLSEVPYMDSSGVASLVKLLSKTKARNIELALQNPTNKIRSIFEITRLDSVFDIVSNQER